VILTACRGGGRASRALTLLESKGFKTAGFCGLRDYTGSFAGGMLALSGFLLAASLLACLLAVIVRRGTAPAVDL